MAKTKCFHVTTAQGETYGVAATGKAEAGVFLQQRLTGEDSTDTPVKAEYVGMWEAVFGTVLHY